MKLRSFIRQAVREALLAESACPECGDRGAYVGMNDVDCPNRNCKFNPNFNKKITGWCVVSTSRQFEKKLRALGAKVTAAAETPDSYTAPGYIPPNPDDLDEGQMCLIDVIVDDTCEKAVENALDLARLNKAKFVR